MVQAFFGSCSHVMMVGSGSEKIVTFIQGCVEEIEAMKLILGVLAITAALAATEASAQINLTGRYQCVSYCRGPGFAFVTQNGWDLNIVNEAGAPSRAWVDYPGHIWIQREDQGAIFSPDGGSIQFDRGTIWQPAPEVVVAPPRVRRRH
jgi:hypothetical protein